MFNVETKRLPIQCAGMSLIGVGSKRPCSWGNYFYLVDGDDRTRSLRIVNMWWENLEHLKDDLGGEVELRIYTDHEGERWALVVDDRVPPDFLYNKLCWTGGYRASKEIARDMYDVLGDPDNEFELFEDPVSYYAKRNAKYDPKTGFVTRYLGGGKPIKGTFKL